MWFRSVYLAVCLSFVMGSIFLPYTAYTKEPDTCKKFWDSYKSQIFNKKPYYTHTTELTFNIERQ